MRHIQFFCVKTNYIRQKCLTEISGNFVGFDMITFLENRKHVLRKKKNTSPKILQELQELQKVASLSSNYSS